MSILYYILFFLYNGNIASMLVNVPKVGEAVLHNYRYDQLNRLTSVSNYNSYDKVSNSWKSTEEHKEALSYDANGNIQTASLNGNTAKLDYEQFSYGYDAVRKNRLLSISNSIDGKNYKYDYDSIGNVIKDELEGNKELQWNVYGKLSKVVKEDGTVIDFTYDAAGNRISKKVGNKEQWYVRDAQGNIMATYIKDAAINKGKLSSESYYKYGSNMLGAWNKVRDVETALPVIEGTLERGQQELYLPNQLGNNMVVINDRKIQNDTNGDGIIDSYDAVVLKAADYSAFGDNLIGREFNGNKIKYGFNGKWNDVETGYQDYGMRMSSAKRRGFVTADPITSKYPMLTPYQFASNRPIDGVDLDGKEWSKTVNTDNLGNTIISYEIKLKVVDKNGCLDKTKSTQLAASSAQILSKAFNDNTEKNVKYNFSIVFEKVESLNEKTDFGLVVADQEMTDRSLNGEAGSLKNTQINTIKLRTQDTKSTFTYDKKTKKVIETKNFVDRNMDDMATTLAHELGHTADLDHPWEETFLKDIQQYQKGTTTRTAVSDETIKTNIMNSSGNKDTKLQTTGAARTTLTPNQVQRVDKVVEYQQPKKN